MSGIWLVLQERYARGRRLTQLRRLSLQSNRLEGTQGLEACLALEELYLSHNGIAKLEVCPLPCSSFILGCCWVSLPVTASL